MNQIRAFYCTNASRGGGIRTHDLFVPNHATWGFDGVGFVGRGDFCQVSCIEGVGVRRRRETLLRTACGLTVVSCSKPGAELREAPTLKSRCQFSRLRR
jgi:hypothetical protein